MTGELWLVRHGETEWSASGRHTSITDIPLTPEGEAAATAIGPVLAESTFEQVFTSPRRRAHDTARLAGFPDAVVDDDLAEWRYGDLEGLTTPQIRETIPDWTVWTHPSPGGETAQQVAERIDRVVARVRSVDGNTLVFAHGHSLAALAARWLGLPVQEGRLFWIDPTTTSVLSAYRETPVIKRWNCAV